ncbi:MAG: YCF48-related protein [bacterium]
MKYFTSLIGILLFFSNLIAQTGTWTQLTAPNDKDYYGAKFITPNTGYFVGVGGNVYSTKDGGTTWLTAYLGANYLLSDIDKASNGTLLVCGGSGSIHKSTDDGVSWIKKTSTVNTQLVDILYVNDNLTFAVGYNGTIIKSNDDGETWITIPISTTGDLQSICFTDEFTGFICDFSGHIYKTTNGGNNWVEKVSNTTEQLYNISFYNKNLGFAVGGKGTFLKTTDAGENWFGMPSPTGSAISAVYYIVFLSETHGWVSAGLSIYETFDGGQTFTERIRCSRSQNTLLFFDENFGYTFGYGGTIYKFTGNGVTDGWVTIQSPINVNFRAVDFPSFNIGYAAGDNATIIKTSDAGLTWNTLTTGGASLLYGIDFTNDTIGYACGYLGLIVKTTNGGTNWFTSFNGSTQGFMDIQFVDENIGLAVANEGLILRTTDAGASWNTIPSGTTAYLKDISLFNNSVLYIAGEQGKILKSTDLGLTWTSLNSPWDAYETVCFTDDTTGFAGGSYGYIRKTTGAGDSLWSITASAGSSSWINSIYFVNSLTGYAACGAVIMKTTDGGTNWEIIKDGLSKIPFDLTFTDELTGFAVGSDGLILKTYMGGITPVEEEIYTSGNVSTFELAQNYPNPFNPTTIIKYSINDKSNVSIKVYDILGKEVANLMNEEKPAGTYQVQFNAGGLASGIYFYSIKAGNFTNCKKMILVK